MQITPPVMNFTIDNDLMKMHSIDDIRFTDVAAKCMTPFIWTKSSSRNLFHRFKLRRVKTAALDGAFNHALQESFLHFAGKRFFIMRETPALPIAQWRKCAQKVRKRQKVREKAEEKSRKP